MSYKKIRRDASTCTSPIDTSQRATQTETYQDSEKSKNLYSSRKIVHRSSSPLKITEFQKSLHKEFEHITGHLIINRYITRSQTEFEALLQIHHLNKNKKLNSSSVEAKLDSEELIKNVKIDTDRSSLNIGKETPTQKDEKKIKNMKELLPSELIDIVEPSFEDLKIDELPKDIDDEEESHNEIKNETESDIEFNNINESVKDENEEKKDMYDINIDTRSEKYNENIPILIDFKECSSSIIPCECGSRIQNSSENNTDFCTILTSPCAPLISFSLGTTNEISSNADFDPCLEMSKNAVINENYVQVSEKAKNKILKEHVSTQTEKVHIRPTRVFFNYAKGGTDEIIENKDEIHVNSATSSAISSCSSIDLEVKVQKLDLSVRVGRRRK